MRIQENQRSSILDGSTQSRVLLPYLYLEITNILSLNIAGTNVAIDDAITDTIGDCFLIVTSRPGKYISKEVCDHLDGEIQIKGLSEESIRECSAR